MTVSLRLPLSRIAPSIRGVKVLLRPPFSQLQKVEPNASIPPYQWNGKQPPERNFVPELHFIEISNDQLDYIGERGQNRIQVFTTDGKWQKDFYN